MRTHSAPTPIDALILIIDQDESTVDIIKGSLDEFENVRSFHNGESALAFCRKNVPDLVLLDAKMQSLDGWATCIALREMTMLSRCPIIFLSEDENSDTEVKAWETGGSDFLRKPIVAPALKMRVMSHLTSHWHIEITNRLYHMDILTGLHNRYYFEKHVKEQIAYAERYNSDISLLIVDIHQFAKFNNIHGHAAGDKAIKQIAGVLKNTVSRKPDAICRYGGEEFTILLPGTDIKGARKVAQKITDSVGALSIDLDNELSGFLTVRLGVSSLAVAREREVSLFDIADEDLAANKILGHYEVA